MSNGDLARSAKELFAAHRADSCLVAERFALAPWWSRVAIQWNLSVHVLMPSLRAWLARAGWATFTTG